MGKYLIHMLNTKNIDKYLPQLVSLDKYLFEEKSMCYCDEIWGEDNFIKDFHKKWDYSCVVMDANEKDLIGFLIVSEMIEREMHIHRLAIDPQFHRHGIGRKLMKKLDVIAQEENVKRITLEVSIANKEGINFYHKNGYEVLSKVALEDYVYNRKVNVVCDKTVICDQRGYQSYIFNKRFDGVL